MLLVSSTRIGINNFGGSGGGGRQKINADPEPQPDPQQILDPNSGREKQPKL